MNRNATDRYRLLLRAAPGDDPAAAHEFAWSALSDEERAEVIAEFAASPIRTASGGRMRESGAGAAGSGAGATSGAGSGSASRFRGAVPESARTGSIRSGGFGGGASRSGSGQAATHETASGDSSTTRSTARSGLTGGAGGTVLASLAAGLPGSAAWDGLTGGDGPGGRPGMFSRLLGGGPHGSGFGGPHGPGFGGPGGFGGGPGF